MKSPIETFTNWVKTEKMKVWKKPQGAGKKND